MGLAGPRDSGAWLRARRYIKRNGSITLNLKQFDKISADLAIDTYEAGQFDHGQKGFGDRKIFRLLELAEGRRINRNEDDKPEEINVA